MRGRTSGSTPESRPELQRIDVVVPVFRLRKLEETLKKYERIAKRAGLPFQYKIHPADRVVDMFFQSIPGDLEAEFKLPKRERDGYVVKVDAALVTVDGVMVPKINGWRLLASLEGIDTGKGKLTNLVHTMGEEKVPLKFRDRVGVCDHCKTNRDRTFTFVLRKDGTDTYQQVGRSCLGQFLQSNRVDDLLGVASLLSELKVVESKDLDDEEDLMGLRGYTRATYPTLEMLATGVYYALRDGYVSKNMAEEKNTLPTSEVARISILDHKELDKKDPLRWKDALERAEKVRKWVLDQPVTATTSDYFRNLHIMIGRERSELKGIGYIVSAYGAYLADERARAEASATGRKYVGKVGEDVFLEGVRVVYSAPYYSEYSGESFITRFADKDGNTLIWMSGSASADLSKRVNETMSIAATVKQHSTNKKSGQPETVLTRVVVDAIPQVKKEPKNPALAAKRLAAKEAERAKKNEEIAAAIAVGLARIIDNGSVYMNPQYPGDKGYWYQPRDPKNVVLVRDLDQKGNITGGMLALAYESALGRKRTPAEDKALKEFLGGDLTKKTTTMDRWVLRPNFVREVIFKGKFHERGSGNVAGRARKVA